jgi:hypothetical protein
MSEISMPLRALWCGVALGLAACSAPPTKTMETSMDRIAEAYVHLVLALGEHDANYVDAYYGPAELREQARAQPYTPAQIAERAQALAAQAAAQPAGSDEMGRLRQRYLYTQLQALAAHAGALSGTRLSFDREAEALYDIRPPRPDEAELERRLAPIEAALPGEGMIADRYNAYVERFAIAPERIDAVMRAAIAEARRRTAARMALPPGEQFELALVQDKPWSAYNWYQGGYHSRIEINTSLPLTITRAIELAVHEGYPGHHVYNALLEQALVRGRGWIEYSVYPLYSPQSLIAEGTADYAIALAFPLEQRIGFVRDVLFPLAGFDPDEAERYVPTTGSFPPTSAATIEAARRYLDGKADADATQTFLRRYALASQARAAQRLQFFDAYRAYIVNYSLGEGLVADYVARKAGDDAARRWAVFAELLASPQLPSGLRGS